MGGPFPHCNSGQLLWPSPMKSTNNSKVGITILGDISISVIWKGSASHTPRWRLWIIMESSPIPEQPSIIWVGENL